MRYLRTKIPSRRQTTRRQRQRQGEGFLTLSRYFIVYDDNGNVLRGVAHADVEARAHDVIGRFGRAVGRRNPKRDSLGGMRQVHRNRDIMRSFGDILGNGRSGGGELHRVVVVGNADRVTAAGTRNSPSRVRNRHARNRNGDGFGNLVVIVFGNGKRERNASRSRRNGDRVARNTRTGRRPPCECVAGG